MSVGVGGVQADASGGADGRGLRVLAVDDEPRALADLARVLRDQPGVAAVECAGDGDTALRRAAGEPFDAVFLDVRMPGLDGLELGRVLRRFAVAPALVFVSAHDDAAVEAFELRALDYLRKPVARRRAAEAVSRVHEALAGGARTEGAGLATGTGAASEPGFGASDDDGDVVAVSTLRGGATRLLRHAEIRYASSYGDFVHVVTADGRYLQRGTLADLERRWAARGFARIHRQYVVNLHHAVELRPQLGGTAELAFADGTTVPVARRHVSELTRRLGMTRALA